MIPIAVRIDRLSIPEPNSGCSLWLGASSETGYGYIKVAGAARLAHRTAWESQNGKIPSGLCVLHRCDNPACVNVDHLFLGVHAENMADMAKKGRSCSGDRNGSRSRPERMRRGDTHARAKLTTPNVLSIRSSTETARALALRFGVTACQIRLIRNGKSWAHISKEVE